MPYSYPNNIPEQIKELPAEAKKIWISTFNSVEGQKDEQTAIKIAWAQVKTKYKKNENGKWVKKEIGDEMSVQKNKTDTKTESSNKQAKGDMIYNNTEDKGFFKTNIPLKLDENNKVNVFEKEVNGVNVKYVRGEASNSSVDKEDDIMSKEFVQKMKTQVMGMNVFAEHKHEIEKTLGYVDEVSGDDNMILDTALESEEENGLVKKILNKIAHGTKIGYSIGGKITKAVKYFDKNLNRTVRKILDGEIYEVSMTAMPAGNVDWIQPIQKSFDKWLEFVNKNSSSATKSNAYVSDEGNLSYDENDKEAKSEDVKKVLDEMIEQEGVYDQIYDLLWSFRSAIRDIVESEDLTPESKKDKIISLGTEFGVKIEELSSNLANLQSEIAVQLGSENEQTSNE